MNAKQARELLRYWHETATPVFEVSARGRVYRMLAKNHASAVQRAMELYADEFGPVIPAEQWTARKVSHVTH